MRIPYKPFPLDNPNPAFPSERQDWWPVIQVRLVDQHMHVRTSPFHAVVDSGSCVCLFHADFLKVFKIRLEDGVEHFVGGVGKQIKIPVFYHDVRILFGIDQVIGVRAGFSPELSVTGILGRHGFFDCYRVQFDHSVHPPHLELNKIVPKVVN